MKENFKGIGLADLCSWFGVTRQAYYQSKKRVLQDLIEQEILLDRISNIRKDHKRLGGRKLFYKLEDFMNEHNIKMGRDAFFDLLREHNLLIKQRKRYHITTNSNHWMKKYPNLIKGLEPLGPNHIWVSDITYWKTKGGHYYISFITDAYSRKIVGYHVADTMEAIESIAALKMAIKTLTPEATGLIHHSDRGSQYCSSGYVKTLKNKGIKISMTENGDPLENAIAERVNGIIKGEYLFDYEIKSLSKAKEILKSVVKLYNEDRPHSSIGNATPSELHDNFTDKEIKRLWKNYYRTYSKCETVT
ncbi:IS3 family transposase [Polaribacter gangjinensis]|uniref:IS3 family transposase n=1 Tax=Polaribacter gangjinensis TaxID=574710 RepID=UPI001D000A15|nr:IS3 family transposase [Polaribacter gangjinensis]